MNINTFKLHDSLADILIEEIKGLIRYWQTSLLVIAIFTTLMQTYALMDLLIEAMQNLM